MTGPRPCWPALTPAPTSSALPSGGFLIADTDNNRIRRVSPDGTITTVAGTGAEGHDGDGGQAINAELNKPEGVAALNGSAFLIADTDNDVIRKVDSDGDITTLAGTVDGDSSGPGSDHEGDSVLHRPRGLAVLASGDVLVADRGHHVIRKVDEDGDVTTVAGKVDIEGSSGDGGLGHAGQARRPYDVSLLPDGGFLIADHDQNIVRKVDSSESSPPSRPV